jgi:hypothetical protein
MVRNINNILDFENTIDEHVVVVASIHLREPSSEYFFLKLKSNKGF